MTVNLKIGFIVIIILAILIIVKNIKDGKLQLSFSIFSIFTGIAMIIALATPSLMGKISSFLGFEVTSNMLFCLSIFMILYLIFQLMIITSDLHRKNVKLIQELSILKERVNELEKKQQIDDK
ncbi:MAG: DUF2304 domain-containing protein [Clostridia bacterium]|nr:DUF2304 domain-containing protein [Clostridia bacterium]